MTAEFLVFSHVSSVQDLIGFYECFWIFLMHWEINFNWRNWCHLDLNATFWSLNWDKRGTASSSRGFIQAVITDQDVQKHPFKKYILPGAGERHSTRDKGHEEGGSAYAKAGSSLGSAPRIFSSIYPPKNQSLPTLLLCALTSDFTGGCLPPPSHSPCQRVNL